MRTEFIYSLAALSAIPVVANADAEAYKADKVQTVGTASDVELAVGTLAKGNYTLTSAAISGANLTVNVMAGETQIATGDIVNGKGISLSFTALNELTDVKIVLVHGTTAITVPAPVVTLKFDFALVANKLQIEHNKLTQALAGYEYPEKTTENTAAVGYYDRIVAIANADYKFYVDNTEGVQDLYADQSKVTGMKLYKDIHDTFDKAKEEEEKYQQGTLGGDKGLLGKYNKTYEDLKTPISYVTDALTNAKNAAKTAYDTYIDDVTNFDNRTAAKNAIAAYKTVLDEVVTVKNDNEDANTELNKALNSVYVYGADNSYYAQTLEAINKNYDHKDNRYAELKGELTKALEAIVEGADYNGVVSAINDSYKAKKAKADKNTLINKIAAFKQKITQTVSDFNALKDQLAAAYTTYDEQKASADELIKNAPADLDNQKNAVLDAVAALKTFIEENDTEAKIGNLTQDAIDNKVKAISDAEKAYSDQKAKYDKYTAVMASVVEKAEDLTKAKNAADTYAKTTKKLDENVFTPSTIWASTIAAINQKIGNLEDAVNDNKWTAAEFETKKEFKDAMAEIQTAIDDFATNAQSATDLYATIAGQVKSAGDEKDKTLAISGIKDLNVWTSQVTTDEAIKARTPYETVINTKIAGNIDGWAGKLETARGKKGQYNPDPKAEGYTNNILGYLLDELKSLGGDASKVLADDIATLKAIQLNYQKDEKAFLDQVDQQQIEGIKTMINTKATEFEEEIAKLQKDIDGKKFGKIKGGLLQTEINAISKKINDAKAVAAKQDATKEEVSAAYNAIKNLGTTDIATAKTNAKAYADAFEAFTTNYNTLNGTENDDENAQTVNGLKAKVQAQKDAIDAKKNLTADQKTALKAKVDAVKKVKQEGEPAVDVTYTIATIDDFIKEAWQNEELTDANVTKYQGIISDLKTATGTPVTQATNLNDLEGQLAAIDFNAAKTAILAKDPNTEGFFVVNKLLGNEKAGQCTFDFNKLKSTIEADEDITPADVTTYEGQINTLKGVINGLPKAAEDNLNALNAAKKAYSDNKPEKIEEQGAVQRYDYYVATLKAKRQTTALEGQLATLATLKEALDQLMADAEAHYAAGTAGTASPTDTEKIDAKAKEIKGKFDEYYNEVNYNAQIAADNLAQYNLIKDAKTKVQQTYDDVAASVINAYKNFKSEELQSATAQAQAELENLLDYLVGYDELVNGDQGIWTRADAAYKVVVSPDKFDGAPYVAEFEVVNGQIQSLTTALLEKIEPLFKDAVSKSVNSYSEAITNSKTKVAKFSPKDEDLTEAQLNVIYNDIDNLLKAINDVKDDADKLAKLDAALVAAADAKNGIKARITNVEQTQAKDALTEIIGKISIKNFDKWESSDKELYYNIGNWIDNYPADCVTYFSTYKKNLNDIKARAAQVDIDQQNIKDATKAITTANEDYNDLAAYYNTVAAGVAVKVEVETIQTELQAISGDVTKDNAVEWKEKAVKISSEEIPTVYNNLFDAEVVVIEGTDGNGGLIAKAREENITYSGDKAAMTTQINTQAQELGVAKAAVEKEPGTAGYKTKEEALADLKNIEKAMNVIIKAITDENGTNLNDVVKEDLNNKMNTLQTNLNNSLKVLKGYTIPAALSTKKANIQTSINNLDVYINDTHANELVAYQENALAMITDIDDAIKALKADAKTEKDNQDKQAADAAIANLNKTWNDAQDLITTAQGKFETMGSELEAYGATTTYANKVKQLKTQIENADGILTAAKAEAEGMETTAEKQEIATKAKGDVNDALAGVANNCDDIIGMAKTAYINAAIADMNTVIDAITWNAADYTKTDNTALTIKKNSIKDAIETDIPSYRSKATSMLYANSYKVGKTNYDGVILSLSKDRATFDDQVADLKQMLKDMSLVEDVKGHIIPGKEEIEIEDMEALADIIINQEEAKADMNRCDINGDNEIDVTDLVWLRYFLVHGEWPNAQAPAGAPALHTFGNGGIDNVTMEATANGNITRVAINLTNETVFKHFQLNLQLPMGAKVVGQRLGERVEGANLLIAQNDNEVRMLAVSTANNVFAGNEGAVVYLDIENLTGDVNIEKVIFVDTALNGHRLNAGETTGIADRISNAIENAGQKIYDLGGRLMNGVKKGINIIRNADGSTKKVINK